MVYKLKLSFDFINAMYANAKYKINQEFGMQPNLIVSK